MSSVLLLGEPSTVLVFIILALPEGNNLKGQGDVTYLRVRKSERENDHGLTIVVVMIYINFSTCEWKGSPIMLSWHSSQQMRSWRDCTFEKVAHSRDRDSVSLSSLSPGWVGVVFSKLAECLYVLFILRFVSLVNKWWKINCLNDSLEL